MTGRTLLVRAIHKSQAIRLVVLLWFFSFPVNAVELDSKSTPGQFLILKNLENSFNQLATQSKIKERITSLSESVSAVKKEVLAKVSAAPVVNPIPSEKEAAGMLPKLTTDPTRINKVDINQTGLEGVGNAGELWKAADAAIQKQTSLPLPVARVVPEVGEKRNRAAPKEAPLTNPSSAQDPDTIPQLTPQTTRFGKDKYDQEKLFNEEKLKGIPLISPSPSFSSSQYQPPLEEKEQDKEKEKELEEKKAREKLDKVILEYAERTEEKSAFNLVDYYDLKGLVSENQELLGKIQDDEFDERFLKNARVIYERFGSKDNSEDKEPFEKFLRRLQPPTRVFSPSESTRKPLPRNSDTHRDRGLSQEESKRSP